MCTLCEPRCLNCEDLEGRLERIEDRLRQWRDHNEDPDGDKYLSDARLTVQDLCEMFDL